MHAVDVVPTVYELLGIEPPEVIKGYVQSPIEGESFAAALTDASVPGKETQFYAMLGQRSIYHQGWLACSVHPPLAGWGNFEHDEWESPSSPPWPHSGTLSGTSVEKERRRRRGHRASQTHGAEPNAFPPRGRVGLGPGEVVNVEQLG